MAAQTRARYTLKLATARFESHSTKDLSQFQKDLDSAIPTSFAAHVLKYTWTGSVMKIEAPGATGFMRYDAGHIIAEISLTFPATMLRDQIIQDIRRIIEAGSGAAVRVL
jgi:Putative polyhydroxyalkanoic acid system protein (PHA_gran_rgn).